VYVEVTLSGKLLERWAYIKELKDSFDLPERATR
jgi:hypothetical protein